MSAPHLEHPLADLYDGTVDELKRDLTKGELCMIADVMNGTWLVPGLVGQHVLANVADSFALYPGMHEQNWGVAKDELLSKLGKLSGWHLGVLEVWAARFWQLNAVADGAWDHGPYLEPRAPGAADALHRAAEKLETAVGLLEKTRGAFKSRLVGEAREAVGEALAHLARA